MLGIAIIGAGTIAREEHIRAWREEKESQVKWIVDADGAKAREVALEYEVPRWSDSLDEILEDDEVEAVDICTSAPTHADLSCRALEAGRHVLVEKPMATSARAAAAMCNAARLSSRVLMVAENWIYASAFRRVQEVINDGGLGQLYSICVVHRSSLRLGNLRPDHRALGHTFIAGSHAVHVMRVLMGDIVEVVGYWHGPVEPGSLGMPNDSAADIIFKFRSGATGNMHISSLSWNPGPRQLFLRVIGDRGQAEFDIVTGCVTVTTEFGSVTEIPRNISLGYEEEIHCFVNSIRGTADTANLATDYVETLRVIEGIYGSFANDGIGQKIDPIMSAPTAGKESYLGMSAGDDRVRGRSRTGNGKT